MNKNEYHRRREKLFETIGDGVAILPAYDYKTMSNDVHYEFRQQSDFLYFTGFEEPNSVALFEGGNEKNTVYLYPKKIKISKYGMVEDMGLREQSKYLEQMRHFK